MVGPFKDKPFKNLHLSPIGLVPKPDNSWRLITHLSYPSGNSVNDGIDESLCSVSYTSFDKVAQMVFKLGKGALMAKRDIKSAFRLLPMHPDEFYLLGIKIDGEYYIDKMLPMGLSLSCALFEKFATFIQWLVYYKSGIDSLQHYLDDFIFAGEKDSGNCLELVNTFTSVCLEIGVPIAEDKSVGPTTVLTFLGLELDSNYMCIRIPALKVEELKQILQALVQRKKLTLRDLQRLVGKLNFFSKAIISSRAFLRRFYDAMIGLKKPFHKIRVTSELRQDMHLWLEFLEEFNGVQFIPEDVWINSDQMQLFTDSAGSANLGCGCFLHGKWAFFSWPKSWLNCTILQDVTFLEMIPVLLSVYLWGGMLKGMKILLHIDNEALVSVINRQTSRSKRLMFLIRKFVLLCMKLEICFRAVHISSESNEIADSISRMQWTRFRQLAPEAEENPEPIPLSFSYLISKMKLKD